MEGVVFELSLCFLERISPGILELLVSKFSPLVTASISVLELCLEGVVGSFLGDGVEFLSSDSSEGLTGFGDFSLFAVKSVPSLIVIFDDL